MYCVVDCSLLCVRSQVVFTAAPWITMTLMTGNLHRNSPILHFTCNTHTQSLSKNTSFPSLAVLLLRCYSTVLISVGLTQINEGGIVRKRCYGQVRLSKAIFISVYLSSRRQKSDLTCCNDIRVPSYLLFKVINIITSS